MANVKAQQLQVKRDSITYMGQRLWSCIIYVTAAFSQLKSVSYTVMSLSFPVTHPCVTALQKLSYNSACLHHKQTTLL